MRTRMMVVAIVMAFVLTLASLPATADSAYSEAVLADGPVAYWRMTETPANGATAPDSADAAGSPQQGAQDATYFDGGSNAMGQATGLTLGNGFLGFENENRGTYLNGADPDWLEYGSTGTGDPLDITGALTIEAWIAPKDQDDDTSDDGIVAKWGVPGIRSYVLEVQNTPSNPDTDGRIAFNLSPNGTDGRRMTSCSIKWDPDAGSGAGGWVIDENYRVPFYDDDPNNWTYVAATYEPDVATKIYFNGQLVAARYAHQGFDIPSAIQSNATDVRVGTSDAGTGSYYGGNVDEVAIYNKTLSAEDVLRHWNIAKHNDAAPLLNGLQANWRLDESSGNFADSSGNGNHATPSGGGVYAPTSGLLNGAADLDGSKLATGPAGLGAFQPGDAFSAAVWVNLDAMPTDFDHYLGRYDLGVGEGWALRNGPGGERGAFSVRMATDDSSMARTTADSVLTGSSWIHLAFSYDGSLFVEGLVLYVNGQEVTAFSENYSSLGAGDVIHYVDTDPFSFGGMPDSVGYVNGLLDEIGLWNRVLTADEVAQLYDGGVGRQIVQTSSNALIPEPAGLGLVGLALLGVKRRRRRA
jgi:hypothetical protein